MVAVACGCVLHCFIVCKSSSRGAEPDAVSLSTGWFVASWENNRKQLGKAHVRGKATWRPSQRNYRVQSQQSAESPRAQQNHCVQAQQLKLPARITVCKRSTRSSTALVPTSRGHCVQATAGRLCQRSLCTRLSTVYVGRHLPSQ